METADRSKENTSNTRISGYSDSEFLNAVDGMIKRCGVTALDLDISTRSLFRLLKLNPSITAEALTKSFYWAREIHQELIFRVENGLISWPIEKYKEQGGKDG